MLLWVNNIYIYKIHRNKHLEKYYKINLEIAEYIII